MLQTVKPIGIGMTGSKRDLSSQRTYSRWQDIFDWSMSYAHLQMIALMYASPDARLFFSTVTTFLWFLCRYNPLRSNIEVDHEWRHYNEWKSGVNKKCMLISSSMVKKRTLEALSVSPIVTDTPSLFSRVALIMSIRSDPQCVNRLESSAAHFDPFFSPLLAPSKVSYAKLVDDEVNDNNMEEMSLLDLRPPTPFAFSDDVSIVSSLSTEADRMCKTYGSSEDICEMFIQSEDEESVYSFSSWISVEAKVSRCSSAASL